MKMIYKNLGKTQIKASAIGFGAGIGDYFGHAGSYDNLENIIKLNIELGSNFIDTAPIYGKGLSEEVVGRAIKNVRGQVVLATKISPEDTTYDGVLKSVEASLKRLQADCIDLCRVHWLNPAVKISETMSAMEKLLDEEKIIGDITKLKKTCIIVSHRPTVTNSCDGVFYVNDGAVVKKLPSGDQKNPGFLQATRTGVLS